MRKISILFFAVAIILLQSGCEVLKKTLQSDPSTQVSQPAEATPAPVIEPYFEEPSNWRPILSHNLETHIVETEALLRLMRYSRQITELTNNELANELKKVQQLNEEKSDTSTQLRLALLLSLPSSQFYNKGEAKKILSDVINTSDEHAPVLREYAYTLLVSIEKTEESERINATLRKKLKKEIDRRQQLEQKLEALKSIEESISQRQNKTAQDTPNSEEVAP
ncbi:hypothetical protein [Kaarinaea lacus]